MSMTPQPTQLTIEDWSCLQARLLWCYEADLRGSVDRRGFAPRNQLSAWWLKSGSVTVRQGGKTWTAVAGQWLFCGPHDIYQDFSEDARILSINFKLEWPSGDSIVDQIAMVAADDFPMLAKSASALLRFIRRHFPSEQLGLRERQVDLTVFFELQRLFSAWAQTYLKTLLAAGVVPTRMVALDPRVMEALRQLDRHDWRTPFREKSLARDSGLSTGHLVRLFVQQLGMTPLAYLQKRRVEAATAALTETEVPAKKIAFDLGFSSASHFTHWLRNAVGKSPRELRNR